MRPLLAVMALSLVSCSTVAGPVTSTFPASTTTTTEPATTTTGPPLTICPPAPYVLTLLPDGVGQGRLDTETLDPDLWTSVPGSHTSFYPRDDGSVAIALIRGTLPAVDWPAEKGEVSIDGTRAAVGPHPDGTWVAGWFEAPGERCDLYAMVFYPPWIPSDVQQVLLGMNRVGG
jgi:hypothetical protein